MRKHRGERNGYRSKIKRCIRDGFMRASQLKTQGEDEMKKIIYNGMMIPNFYGLAYWDYAKDEGVCYPMPINLFVILCRDFVMWIKNPKGKW